MYDSPLLTCTHIVFNIPDPKYASIIMMQICAKMQRKMLSHCTVETFFSFHCGLSGVIFWHDYEQPSHVPYRFIGYATWFSINLSALLTWCNSYSSLKWEPGLLLIQIFPNELKSACFGIWVPCLGAVRGHTNAYRAWVQQKSPWARLFNQARACYAAITLGKWRGPQGPNMFRHGVDQVLWVYL